MTEKRFEIDLMNMELEDRDIVCQAGKFRLEEWGKHRLHQFYDGDTPLEDETVVIRLMDLTTENKQLKQQIGNLEHTRDFCADVCADCERLEEENKQLKQQIDELEECINYKRLFKEFSYYFKDIKSLNELDHKDFRALQLLCDGEYFDDNLETWCKVKL